MSTKNREEIRDLIYDIETSYPVNEWMHNGYHIWPVLRIHLYLALVKQDEINGSNKNVPNGRFENVPETLRGAFSSLVDYIKLEKDIESIYCGAPSHRVQYQGQEFNRYFDHLMDKQSAKSLLVEGSTNTKENYYKSDRVILVSDLIKCFRLDLKTGDLLGRKNKFAKKLGSIIEKEHLQVRNYVSQATRYISNVERAVSFFEKLLRKTIPERVYELCYYSTSLLGLNIAADKLGIKTIDVQHGPQGEHHLAYGSWHLVPAEGYEALPSEFHTWDQSSANIIEQSLGKTTKHSATVTGNRWVDGWKKGEFETSDYPWPDNIVLYTLQPSGNPLEPYLLETIKQTCEKWNWWLRLHPRQMSELPTIKNKLKNHDLLDKVNLEDATKLLLPDILLNTKAHLTKFSGSAIEAFNFQTPTIILDKRGESVFNDYFEHDIMISCTGNDTDLLIAKINSLITRCP